MEKIELILSQGTRDRIERTKRLRAQESNGKILADQEIITAAINCYWLVWEKKRMNKND